MQRLMLQNMAYHLWLNKFKIMYSSEASANMALASMSLDGEVLVGKIPFDKIEPLSDREESLCIL